MPRRARIKVGGQPWHIMQRGVNHSRCFSGVRDRELYLSLLREQSAAHDCAVHAYVLMTNHVHLLVTPATDESASRMMKAIGERYVRAFNKAHKRSGTLWEGRFKSSIVESRDYLFNCYRYVELNPVRAGMVARPGDYEWSSYRANAEGIASDFIRPHPLYLALAQDPQERCRRYRRLFRSRLDEERLDQIREAIRGGFSLGSTVHHAMVETHCGMRSQRLRRRRALLSRGLSPNKWSVP